MLQVENMTVRFAGLSAVSDLSFQVRPGEIFTMMGPNGAGKTTAFNAITGFVRPAGGAVSYKGVSLLGRTPDQIAAMRSEEHTSELQSLMRISYAVFCLKKKTQHPSRQHYIYYTVLLTITVSIE